MASKATIIFSLAAILCVGFVSQASAESVEQEIIRYRNAKLSTRAFSTFLLTKLDPQDLNYLSREGSLSNKEWSRLGPKIVETSANLLSEQSVEVVSSIEQLLPLLREKDAPSAERIDSLVSLRQKIEKLLASEDLEALRLLNRRYRNYPLEQKIIASSLVPILNEALEKAASFSNPLSTISLLADIPVGWQTDKHREIAALALEQLSKDKTLMNLPSLPVWSADSEKLFKEVSGSKEGLATLFAYWTLYQLEQQNLLHAMRLFGEAKSLSKEQSSIMRELRLAISEYNFSADSQRFARDRVKELSTLGQLSFSDRIKFLSKGYFGHQIVVIILIASTGIIVATLLLKKLALSPGSIALNRAKRKKRGYAMAPSRDEYSVLLDLFDLDDTASEKQIKAAYRNKMKELHPDHATSEPSPEMQEDFVKLKKAHDRILEIKRSRFSR